MQLLLLLLCTPYAINKTIKSSKGADMSSRFIFDKFLCRMQNFFAQKYEQNCSFSLSNEEMPCPCVSMRKIVNLEESFVKAYEWTKGTGAGVILQVHLMNQRSPMDDTMCRKVKAMI
jgi:hypothetical protein